MLLTVLFIVLEKNGNNLVAQEWRNGHKWALRQWCSYIVKCSLVRMTGTEPVISMEKRQSENIASGC